MGDTIGLREYQEAMIKAQPESEYQRDLRISGYIRAAFPAGATAIQAAEWMLRHGVSGEVAASVMGGWVSSASKIARIMQQAGYSGPIIRALHQDAADIDIA